MTDDRLTRSGTDKIIAGVCGGLADYLAIDPIFVRLAFLLLIPSGGIGIPLYISLMLIMPDPTAVDKPSSEVLEQNIEKLGDTIMSSTERLGKHPRGPVLFGALLILLGGYMLLKNLGWINLSFGIVGPALLILLGLYLLMQRRAS